METNGPISVQGPYLGSARQDLSGIGPETMDPLGSICFDPHGTNENKSLFLRLIKQVKMGYLLFSLDSSHNHKRIQFGMQAKREYFKKMCTIN